MYTIESDNILLGQSEFMLHTSVIVEFPYHCLAVLKLN
jgi:hypothetical protein